MLHADGSTPVLIVDDDPGMRRTLQDLLELEGYSATVAETGAGALELFKPDRYPISLVDLRLPDTDGLSLALKLTAIDAATQIIIVTGNATVESAVRAVRDYGCDYLVKPVQPPELLRTVAAARDRWRLAATKADLERSESMTAALFAASPLPMVILDPSLRIRLWNPTSEAVFGWSEPEVVGRTLSSVVRLEDVGALSRLRQASLGQPCVGIEVTQHRRDGSQLVLHLHAAGVQTSTGATSAILVVYEDVTEQKRIQEHLHHVQRLDAIGRLAGGIAHDFNNLLAVLRSELDLLFTDDRLDPGLADSVKLAQETTTRGAALTRQLLSFARRQPMESSVMSVNDVVSNLERMLRRLLVGPIQLELELGADEESALVNVDRGQLEQVLTNLLVNARDAIDGPGRITIATSKTEAGPERSQDGLDAGEWVTISVSDTGSGIPLALRSRIFEPFFTTKPPGSGTGLGLATSFGIIQGLGGTLTLDSEVGVGTTFTIGLPRAERVREASAEPGTAQPGRGAETILMVEDNQMLRDATRRLLIRQGYTVYAAEDGLEARKILSGMSPLPDLVLVDAHLPSGDGRDLINALRNQHPGLRFLLTSGSLEVAGRSDVDVPFLEKPYTLQSLSAALRKAIEGQRPDGV